MISRLCGYLSKKILISKIQFSMLLRFMAAELQSTYNTHKHCIWRRNHVGAPDLLLAFRAQSAGGWCQRWTGLKWGQREACPAPGWAWPGCIRWKLQHEIFNSCPLVPSRREKKLLVHSKLWAPVSWSVQEGILAHPRGQIKLRKSFRNKQPAFCSDEHQQHHESRTLLSTAPVFFGSASSSQ